MIKHVFLEEKTYSLTGIGYYAQEDIEGNIENVTLWEINGMTFGSYVEHPRKCDDNYCFTNVITELVGNVMSQIKFPETEIEIHIRKNDDEETFEIIDKKNCKILLSMTDKEFSEGIITSKEYISTPFNCSSIENMFVTKYKPTVNNTDRV